VVGGLYVRDQFTYPAFSAMTGSQGQRPNADLAD
jgi:hypothetical protein